MVLPQPVALNGNALRRDELDRVYMHSSALHCVSPGTWGETLPCAPILNCRISHSTPVLVRRWRNISPDIDQAALDHHFLSIHLGGPKRLLRTGEGIKCSREVEDGAHSVVPAGAAFQWNTVGPVDFAHVYVAPNALNALIAETFDRDPARIEFRECLGKSDQLVRSLALTLLEEMVGSDLHRAYVDDIVQLLLSRLLCLHSDVKRSKTCAQHTLAPFRLRRALEFIEANLKEPVGVAEIAAASGISPFHFSRAFRQTTGRPPYAYLLERRIARSKELLRNCDLKLLAIATQCGFTSLSQFSRMFRHHAGGTPTRYRNDC